MMKRIVLFTVLLSCFIQGVYAQTSYLEFDWQYRPNAFINKVLIADLNNDGVNELIASSSDGIIYNLGKRPKDHLNWQHSLKGDVRVLEVVDFDGDGKKEVIAGTTASDRNLEIIDWQGLMKGSTIDFASPVNSAYPGDIDGDGLMDLAISSIKTVYAMRFTRKDEKILWSYQTDGRVNYLYVSDFNKDKKGEIVALAYWSDNEEDKARVYMFNSDGKVMWSYDVEGGIAVAAAKPIDFFDLDSDGLEEIIVGSKKGVAALKSDGKVLWTQKTEKQVNVVYTAEIGNKPVVFLGATPKLYALDSSGAVMWTLPVDTTIYSIAGGDIENDGVFEIVLGTNKHLVVASADGRQIAKLDYGKDIKAISQTYETRNVDIRSVALGDLDGDGKKEVAMGIGWVESRLDHNYYFGDIEVYRFNSSSKSSSTTKPVEPETTTTVRKTTTTASEPSTTTTQFEEATETTAPPKTGGQDTNVMIVSVLGLALLLILVLIGVVIFLLLRRKH